MDAKEPPRHLRKTLIFLAHFAFVALPDPFSGRCRRALHVQNKPKSIDFITFRTPRLGPTYGTKGNIQNSKMSATLHGSASVQNETSATLHGKPFCIRTVQMAPPKEVSLKWPKPLAFKSLACFFPDPTDGGRARGRRRAKRAPRCMGARFRSKHVKKH